jgi:hypothetical protein
MISSSSIDIGIHMLLIVFHFGVQIEVSDVGTHHVRVWSGDRTI